MCRNRVLEPAVNAAILTRNCKEPGNLARHAVLTACSQERNLAANDIAGRRIGRRRPNGRTRGWLKCAIGVKQTSAQGQVPPEMDM